VHVPFNVCVNHAVLLAARESRVVQVPFIMFLVLCCSQQQQQRDPRAV
jgi:hypothetical protein